MRLLLDTHLVLWAAIQPERLSRETVALLTDPANELVLSVASLWEVAIKYALRQHTFDVDPRIVHRDARDAGYEILEVNAEHAIAVASLPPIHRDPFDRLLIAQAMVEGVELLTADPVVARYPGATRLI